MLHILILHFSLHMDSATTINKILPYLENLYPSFAKMFLRYGSEQIRNVASIGGNLASASPIGDSSPVLIALGAKIIINGNSKRELLLKDFLKVIGKLH